MKTKLKKFNSLDQLASLKEIDVVEVPRKFGILLSYQNHAEKPYWCGLNEDMSSQFMRTSFEFAFNYGTKFSVENNILTIENADLFSFDEWLNKNEFKLEKISSNSYSIENCQIVLDSTIISDRYSNYENINYSNCCNNNLTLTLENQSIITNRLLYRHNAIEMHESDCKKIANIDFKKYEYYWMRKYETLNLITFEL